MRSNEGLLFKCKLCDKTTKSQNGLLYHLRSKHPKQPGCRKGVNWEYVGGDGTPKKKKPQQRTIAPDMQYIEVPAIIRIPVSMGPIQIVAIDN